MIILVTYEGQRPIQMTAGATGFDISTAVDVEPSNKPLVIPAGVRIHVDEAFQPYADVQIRPRSSTTEFGYTVEVGTIDADYRGEIKIKLLPIGPEQLFIRQRTRLAQLVFGVRGRVIMQRAEDLPVRIRGEGGHGSTGASAV